MNQEPPLNSAEKNEQQSTVGRMLGWVPSMCGKVFYGVRKVSDAVQQPLAAGCHKLGIRPDQVTLYRVPIGIAAVIAYVAGQTELACSLYAMSTYGDALDGAVARNYPEMRTNQGAQWDSGCDKVVNNTALVATTAMNFANPVLAVGAGVSVAVDTWSSHKRAQADDTTLLGLYEKGWDATWHPEKYPLIEADPDTLSSQSAGALGKVKMIGQSVAIFGLMLATREEFDAETAKYITDASTYTLWTANALGIGGVATRGKKKA